MSDISVRLDQYIKNITYAPDTGLLLVSAGRICIDMRRRTYTGVDFKKTETSQSPPNDSDHTLYWHTPGLREVLDYRTSLKIKTNS